VNELLSAAVLLFRSAAVIFSLTATPQHRNTFKLIS
jgi:hypothetical protein